MQIVTRGLVLRETDYKDGDKMLTILTAERGKVSARCRGARFRSSTLKAGTQLFVCSEFTLYESRGRYSVDSAEPVELFFGLRSDIEALALASYFSEVLESVSVEDTLASALLSDALNSMYALSKKLKDFSLIKAVFELRAAAFSGFAPNLGECAECGETLPGSPLLNIGEGQLVCADCVAFQHGIHAELDPQALAAARYALVAETKKMLAFTLGGGSLLRFCRAAERYLLSKLDRRFSTLEFYKSLVVMPVEGI